MGSVTFPGEDESQPSTSSGKSCKLSRMLLDGCDAVNHASVPRKLRSAIKKRGREFINSPLLVSKKQRHASTTVGTLKKVGAKKLKLNMVQHITKDEEEVAETLFSLASFFAEKDMAHQPGSNCEKPEIKSSATLQESSAARDTFPTPLALNLLSPEVEEIKPQTFKTPQHNAHGGQSETSPRSSSRPLVSILGMNQNGEHEINLDQVTASGIQCRENFNSISDRYKGLFLSPNVTAATGSATYKSCPSAELHTWFGSTNFSSQPRAIEKKVATEKHTKVAPESNPSWKRCSAHVYISRLIKILQVSNRKIESPLQHTQSTACKAKERQSNGRNDAAYFSGMNLFDARKDSSNTKNHILLDKRHAQDQQMASETCSAKKEFDFLSLGTGLCGLDTGKGTNGARCFREPPQQFHMPYMQSQYSNSLSFHGHNSALAAQQVELQRQKWAAQLQAQYNKGGGGSAPPRLPDRRNGGVDSASVLNYAHSLFPHLHAALGSKYQHFSPSQQPVMAMNPNFSRLHHNLPLGFDRQNGADFRPENMAQLQHPSN